MVDMSCEQLVTGSLCESGITCAMLLKDLVKLLLNLFKTCRSPRAMSRCCHLSLIPRSPWTKKGVTKGSSGKHKSNLKGLESYLTRF